MVLALLMHPEAEASQDVWDGKRWQRRTFFARVQERERFGRKQRTEGIRRAKDKVGSGKPRDV